VRWDQLLLAPPPGDQPDEGERQSTPLPLALPNATVRTFDTPEFRGMTFYEVRARSIINRVPASSRMFFEWTVNPYRGCTHACVYCFARNTHTYLDLDAGHDFDSKVVVKVNAPQLLRRELAAPKWAGAHIAMGTNVDCYQRAEGRYRLMPGILTALRDFGNPFSILTKGTLILRDLDLLVDASRHTTVGLAMSVGCVDEALWRAVEPGTPSPRRRLDAVAKLSDKGFDVGVLMAPICPASATPTTSSTPRSGRSWRPAPPASRRSRCTCAPAPASGTSAGWAGTGPTSCRATGSCTRGGRTSPPRTRRTCPNAFSGPPAGTGSRPRAAARRALPNRCGNHSRLTPS